MSMRLAASRDKKESAGAARAQLLAGAKLPEHRIREIIRCYAEGLPVKEAMARCRISHVTAYRIYGLLRVRMLQIGLYKTYEQFGAERDEDEEEGGYFPWERLKPYLTRQLAPHRGISNGNRWLHLAEKLFKFEDRYSPGEFYRLILLAIRMTGPLNRPPRPFDSTAFSRKLLQLLMADIRATFANSILKPETKEVVDEALQEVDTRAEGLLKQADPLQYGQKPKRRARPKPSAPKTGVKP
ncbi:MAG TPA: hypothetical protein VGN83_04485 [Falsiroseomonas sp.]|jgi:hypothetical protein|nr:hypothetical protein [Falsiroseomonas sp.]